MATSKSLHSVSIVGSGPAGLTAAIHAAFEGLHVTLYERGKMGGQAATTSLIQNYPGFEHGVDGHGLIARMHTQASDLGVQVVQQEIVSCADLPSDQPIILATGLHFRSLGLPGEAEYAGRGLWYGPHIHHPLRVIGKQIAIIGAANAAGQAALYYARYARRVTIISRHETVAETMSERLRTEIAHHQHVGFLCGVSPQEVVGDDQEVQGLWVAGAHNERLFVPASTVLVCAGQQPASGFADLLHDGRGYMVCGGASRMETSRAGVYAIGDCRSGNMAHRVAAAVGEGARLIAYLLHQEEATSEQALLLARTAVPMA